MRWEEIIKNSGRLKVLCGAGISANSGIPLANQTLEYLFSKYGLGEDEIEKLLAGNIPFEDWMQMLINLRVQGEELLDLYRADEISPCKNHKVIAKLVAEGVVQEVYTSNFDTLIEQALLEEGLQRDVDFKVFYREEDFIHISQSGCAKVIKFHGSAEDIESIRITLDEITVQQKNEKRARAISSIFAGEQGEKPGILLVLGYSCSDIFDVQPCMETIAGPRAKILYVQHKEDGELKENIFHAYLNEKFPGYSGCEIVGSTDSFIQNICSLYGIDCPEDTKKHINAMELLDKYTDGYFSRFLIPQEYKTMQARLMHRVGDYEAAAAIIQNASESGEWLEMPNMKHMQGNLLLEDGEYEKSFRAFYEEVESHLQTLCFTYSEKIVGFWTLMTIHSQCDYQEFLRQFSHLLVSGNFLEKHEIIFDIFFGLIGELSALGMSGKTEITLPALALMEGMTDSFISYGFIRSEDKRTAQIKKSVLFERFNGLLKEGQYAEAAFVNECLLDFCRKQGELKEIAIALCDYVQIQLQLDRDAEVSAELEEIMEISDKINHSYTTCHVLYAAVYVYILKRDLHNLEKVIAKIQTFVAGQPKYRCFYHPVLWMLFEKWQDRGYRSSLLTMLILLREEIPDKYAKMASYIGFEIYEESKKYYKYRNLEGAFDSLEDARIIFQCIGLWGNMADCLQAEGQILEHSLQPQNAFRLYCDALRFYPVDCEQKAQVLVKLGRFYYRRGDKESARSYYTQAEYMFEKLGLSKLKELCRMQIKMMDMF